MHVVTAFLLLCLPLPAAEPAPRVLDIGAPGDEAWLVDGFYGREGPAPKSKMPVAAANTFRWMKNRFTLRIPVTPGQHNRVTLIGHPAGDVTVNVGEAWKTYVFAARQQREATAVIPAEVVGARDKLEIQVAAVRPMRQTERDKRELFFLLAKVIVQPVDRLPAVRDPDRPVDPPGPAEVRDRLRGIENRPVCDDPEAFARRLALERADVVTLGTMYGQGRVFFPTDLAEVDPRMEPTFLPEVIRQLRLRGIGVLSWVVFNIQDTRDVNDFAPGKRYPQWRMQFIDEPGKTWKPRVGMCLASSPYIEHHAKLLQQAARFDLDGFFFDGFYLGGIPHPSRPGCVCEFCRKAFKQDARLDLPAKVDWNDMTFKRWVRWRNERLLRTASFFQEQIRQVNLKAKCTFNTNLWPFANKDWETAIPMWRINDWGVSQHGYSGRFQEKWLMLGFKCRIGRDMNPQQTDVWRAASLSTTCGPGKVDWDWHKLEMLTFILAATSHGITPWHSTIEGPTELTADIFAEAAKREPYFSRNYVADVGVLCSQNTHDFYGHLPGTENLADYRDGLLGTWMLLTENHVPFEFVFDNQIGRAVLAKYKTLLLPNTAAMSEQSMRTLADWVTAGGHLVTTAQTGQRDEWAHPLTQCRLTTLWKIDPWRPAELAAGQGRVTHLPDDPGLAWCRRRDAGQGRQLVSAVRRRTLPLQVSAPNTLLANLFVNPRNDHERWVHLLNVSHLMPGGDSGYRGVQQAIVPRKETGSDADLGARSIVSQRKLVPAENVRLRVPGLAIESARLAIAGKTLSVSADGEILIPKLDLHDVVVLTLRSAP